MDYIARHEKYLKRAVFAAIAILYVVQALTRSGLYGDSFYFILNMLVIENARAHHVASYWNDLYLQIAHQGLNPLRFWTYVLMDLPVVLALRSGVHHLDILNRIYATWIVLPPLLLWGFALWKTRETKLFWFFVLMFAVIYFDGNLYITGEGVISYALTACCLVFLLQRQHTRGDLVACALAADLLTLSYSSTVLIGPFFAYLAYKQTSSTAAPQLKLYWSFLGALFALSGFVGLWSVLHPIIPYLLYTGTRIDVVSKNPEYLILTAYALVVGVSYFAARKKWKAPLLFCVATLGILAAAIYFYPYPYQVYGTRIFMALVVFAFCCGITLVARQKEGKLTRQHSIAFVMPVFLLMLSMTGMNMYRSWQIGRYLSAVEEILSSEQGVLPYEGLVMLLPKSDVLNWHWIYPSMSLVLRKSAEGGIIAPPIVRPYRFDPVDPFNPPDLSRYY